ncbi:MAG: transposase [Paracoccaceae bacterium]
MTEDTPVIPDLSPVCGLDVHARFDGGRMSSNGGALLLREASRGPGLAGMLASCIEDRRGPAKTLHSYSSMIQARMIAIACGHEDCDDMDILRHDPTLKMSCEKTPDAAVGLASQPTLSRLENTVSWRPEKTGCNAASCHPCRGWRIPSVGDCLLEILFCFQTAANHLAKIFLSRKVCVKTYASG